jgi:hypothetical protein
VPAAKVTPTSKKEREENGFSSVRILNLPPNPSADGGILSIYHLLCII